ncbi:MAG: response regulator [Deltaproteobacteria bacterium]|nr:response regulator [Deltaproteobacteria bacterium]
MSTPRGLLVVDDDEVLRERLARALRDRGLDVRTAGDVEEALARAEAAPPELALVDLRLPGRSGLDLVRELRSRFPDVRIVVLTGYGSIANAVEAMRLGATHYLSKPADADEILAAFAPPEGEAETDGEATQEVEAPSLARAEWEHINRVLADSSGNVSEAARRLGLHRRSLQRKLNKLPPKS